MIHSKHAHELLCIDIESQGLIYFKKSFQFYAGHLSS